MTTAAAIDRLVHHAVILEMVGTSVRAEEAQSGLTRDSVSTTTTPAVGNAAAAATPEEASTTTINPNDIYPAVTSGHRPHGEL